MASIGGNCRCDGGALARKFPSSSAVHTLSAREPRYSRPPRAHGLSAKSSQNPEPGRGSHMVKSSISSDNDSCSALGACLGRPSSSMNIALALGEADIQEEHDARFVLAVNPAPSSRPRSRGKYGLPPRAPFGHCPEVCVHFAPNRAAGSQSALGPQPLSLDLIWFWLWICPLAGNNRSCKMGYKAADLCKPEISCCFPYDCGVSVRRAGVLIIGPLKAAVGSLTLSKIF